MPTKYRADVDGLRAVAVLSVLGFHGFPTMFPGGFVGVDVFFVISGYLISKILATSLDSGEFRFQSFYSRRIKRLFPSLLCVLVVSLMAGWALFYRDEFYHLCTDILSGLGFVSNIALWNETSYFNASSDLKPLLHLWSLAIEEQFYFLWPAALFMCWKLSLKRFNVISILLVSSFVANLIMVINHPATAFFLPMYRGWELLLGALLAEKLSSEKPRELLSAFGLTLILFSIFYINKSNSFPGWRALIPTLGAICILFGGPGTWVSRKILSSRPLIFVGLISYPLYLWHWPLLSFAKIVFPGQDSAFLRATLLLTSFLLAWITYKLVETPLRHSRSEKMAPALVTAAVALLFFSGVVRRSDPLLSNYFQAQRDQLLWDEDSEKFNSTESCRKEFNLHGNDDKCLMSNPSKSATVAVFGDSHANSLYFGLESFLNRTPQNHDNLINLGRGGCPPFWNTVSESLDGGAESQCSSTMTAILERLMKDSSIHTVIIANQARLYLAGYRTLQSNDLPVTASASEIYEHQLRVTIQKLLRAKKRVILALDFPDFDFDPRYCLSRFPAIGPRRANCYEKRETIEARRGDYKNIINRILRDFGDLEFIDFDSVYCDKSVCSAMKDGVLLYRDAAHLSLAGSLYFADKIEIQKVPASFL